MVLVNFGGKIVRQQRVRFDFQPDIAYCKKLAEQIQAFYKEAAVEEKIRGRWRMLCISLTQFFFSGFNTAIYAIIPDCAEYGQWKTGLRNDGFQYAFISLGNKVGMALGTAMLAGLLGKFGYVADQQQNDAVILVMRQAFTTVPGVLWIVTAVVLLFYRLNKTSYNRIVEELKKR